MLLEKLEGYTFFLFVVLICTFTKKKVESADCFIPPFLAPPYSQERKTAYLKRSAEFHSLRATQSKTNKVVRSAKRSLCVCAPFLYFQTSAATSLIRRASRNEHN